MILGRLPQQHRAPRLPACSAGKKGFGKQAAPPPPPPKKRKPRPVKEALEGVGKSLGDEDATRDAHALLKAFGAAQDKNAFAFRERHRLSQQFFALVDWFLRKAESNGDVSIALDMRSTLAAATRVKGATLRPELQLVSRIFQTNVTAEQRREILASRESLEALRSNDSYALLLLDQMLEDAASNRYSSVEDREAVMQQLRETRADCEARLREGEREDAAQQQQLQQPGQRQQQPQQQQQPELQLQRPKQPSTQAKLAASPGP